MIEEHEQRLVRKQKLAALKEQVAHAYPNDFFPTPIAAALLTTFALWPARFTRLLADGSTLCHRVSVANEPYAIS